MEAYNDEFMYSELLEEMKKKELEKENSYYLPVYVEPPIEHQKEKDELIKSNNEKNRGVVIIEF